MTDTYWPDHYMTPEREDEPNWNWLYAWERENPRPNENRENFDEWWARRTVESNRVWVAWVLPQFHVFDWPEERVQAARELIRGLVCGVCGRIENPGCVRGC